MADVTGEGRFTASYQVPTTGFGGAGIARYDLATSAVFRRTGTDPDQCDRIHALRYTFVASTPQEIDLLALVGPRIRLLKIKFLTTTPDAATLKLGGALANPWIPIGDLTIYPGTTLNPGGLTMPAAGLGIPVTSGSKVLKMLPSAHAFSIDLLALGASV